MEKQLETVSAAITASATEFFRREGTQRRYLVGITGRPGSGKSTVSRRLCQLINQNYSRAQQLAEGPPPPLADALAGSDQNHEISIVVSLDGWHYPRSVLDQFPDPEEAHRRRGAPETFDAAGYGAFVAALAMGTAGVLLAPEFSHAAKDPVADAIAVLPHHHLVILEGLYTLLQDGPHWAAASAHIHIPILVHALPDTAKNRLVNRHVQAGISPSPHLAAHRVDSNDHPNGEYLLKHSRSPLMVITSIDDPSLRTVTDQVP
ncbi:hypothetical protein PCANC_05425 [Puccinia coronata f. sp. avenae]|uniref:Phosphoribulokinase/uridine kinase domain-containing protein n=1 Tax=Puccinia coronata f. sp. avenae TaxID=200324 RepID=A0A2N5V8A8_9BASI|nr:hypothetical protein PCASD_20724 [Puccinia coronata f. sp. avenae]PLW21205.1 hypothetical protein PCANC_05425 [Puccinia coronata f. sp. avenae]PLW46230.1 hypothetical protein PCASD_03765 [Puccinia coronata f. sp. avenae]